MSVEMYKGRHKEKDPQKKSVIIFVGPEGSGKSTIGKMLSKNLDKPYISTGDIIRERAKHDAGPLGDACRKMIKDNAYLEPKLLMDILSERLAKDDLQNGVIIDGGLRTLTETRYFDEVLEKAGKSNSQVDVFFLNIPDELGIERRLNSKDLRPGENRQSVIKRLGHFYEDLDERMRIVKERYNFYNIDATKNIDEVFNDVLSLM